MRPLTLHVSALSDSEYDFYTTSLSDLTTHSVRDDARYERTSVGVREVRAWLRGRFCNLPASDIDSILKLFCPNMLPSDTLTGGQFFAALRLVIHAGSGKGIDRTLAFVQASPGPAKAATVPRPLSPPKRPVRAPPSHPDRQKPLPHVTPSPETNPFTRRSMEHGAPLVPPADTEHVPQQCTNKISQNPFLARDNVPDKVVPPAHVSNQGKLPPLPPRKPSLHAAPPRRPSEFIPASMTPSGPPLIPMKPTHVMSPLMRQSLDASKHAQSLKRAEEQLDRERVLQVLKTSSSSSSNSNTTTGLRTRSLSPSKQLQKPSNGRGHGSASGGSDDATFVPPLPRRRKPSQPSSTSSSALSLEQVASATLPSVASPPFRPPLPNRDFFVSSTHAEHTGLPAIPGPGPIPPPTHPQSRRSTSTEPNVNDSQPPSPSSPRAARSKSVMSSSSAPPPPPRRKRPESMQLTPTSEGGAFPTFLPVLPPHTQMHGRTASLQGLSRHLSLTRGREQEPSDSSAIANIQKTLSNFQLKAQPKLDAVRYKAEAGISKRGYVHHPQLGGTRWREEGEQGLMADTRWSATDVDRDLDSEPTTDEELSSGGDDRGSRRTTKAAVNDRDFLAESDNLKWPMGEGWKPL